MLEAVSLASPGEPFLWGCCPFCWEPFACFHPDCDDERCAWLDCWRCSNPDLGGWTVASALPFLGPRLPGGPLSILDTAGGR